MHLFKIERCKQKYLNNDLCNYGCDYHRPYSTSGIKSICDKPEYVLRMNAEGVHFI